MITARSYFWQTLTQQPTLSTHHRSTIYQPTLVNDRDVLRKYRNWEEEQVALPRHDPNRNANMLVLGLSKALAGWFFFSFLISLFLSFNFSPITLSSYHTLSLYIQSSHMLYPLDWFTLFCFLRCWPGDPRGIWPRHAFFLPQGEPLTLFTHLSICSGLSTRL